MEQLIFNNAVMVCRGFNFTMFFKCELIGELSRAKEIMDMREELESETALGLQPATALVWKEHQPMEEEACLCLNETVERERERR